MKKRLLSIALCLCMVLTLLPSVALADGETANIATSVIVGGVELTSTGAGSVAYATTDGDGNVTLQPDYTEDSAWNIKFQHGTLTLKNATIAGVTGTYGFGSKNVGIYAADSLILVLEGTNTVTGKNEDGFDDPANGIYVYYTGAANSGSLTIRGGGTLNASTTGTGDHVQAGIQVSGKLTIESGTITATGGKTDFNSFGVWAVTDFVMTGGSLEATGGNVTGGNRISDGIYANTVAISGGTVTATGGTSTGNSHGISASAINIKPSTDAEVQVTAETTETKTTVTHRAFNIQPTIGDAVYNWKTTEGDETTLSLTAAYDYTDKTYTALTLGQTTDSTSVLNDVTYGKVNGDWVEDVTSTGLDLSTPPATETTYKAGSGTVVWTPTLTNSTVTGGTLTFTGAEMNVSGKMETKAAVTLPNLTGGVKVVFEGENSITANTYSSAYAFKCMGNTIFALSADSHTTIFASGQDAYAITNGFSSVSADATIEITGTGKLTVNAQGGDGNPYAIFAPNRSVSLTGGGLNFNAPVTGDVILGGIVIPLDTTLDLSAAASVTKGDTGATVHGKLLLPSSVDPNALGIIGDGNSTVQVGDDTYRYKNNKWVLSVPLTGLDLTSVSTQTSWQAGSGTVTYIPAAGSANAQLIFDGAHMSVRKASGNATAVTLPSAAMDVIFKGQNEISAAAPNGDATTFSASADTTFTAQAGSKTTLNATGNNSKAIFANGGDVTLNGTGELLLAPTMNDVAGKSNGYAIHAEGKTVTIGDGITLYEPRVNTDSTTATKNGTGGILAGAVKLNAATIPEGGTLDMHGADTAEYGAGKLVNNGTLILPSVTTYENLNAMNLTGSGVVKIGDAYYKNVKGTWMTDITYTGLDLVSNAPAEKTTYAAGEGTVTYTPGVNGGDPTLTLNNATIAPLVQEGNTGIPPLVLGSAKLVLAGSSYLKGTGVPALCGYNNDNLAPAGSITIGGSGSLRLEGKSNTLGSFGATSLTLEDTATVTSPDGTVGAVTVGENAKLNAVLKVDGTQTVYGKNTIAEDVTQFYTNEALQWADGASFEVNGELTLANGTDFNAIKGNLSGSGIVRIVTKTVEGSDTIETWDAYLTNGTKLHAYKNLNFTLLPTNGGAKRDNTTLEDDGYTFTGNSKDGYVLTLGNLDINCNDPAVAALALPTDGKVVVKLAGDARVANTGTAMQFPKGATEYSCTISGSGSLRLTSNGGGAHGLEAKQPLTITGGTLRILTTSKTFPAINASGLTLSGMRIKSPRGAVVGSYGTTSSYDTVLAADGKPAASVSLVPVGGSSGTSDYTLTFETNGGSAIAKVSKASDTTVDLTAYVPTREGYTFAGWYADEALTEKVTSVKLTDNTTVYAKWTEAKGETALPFTDVAEGAYYYDAVKWAVENGVTDGTSATTFAPGDTCTRGQTVTFLWRAMGSPEPTAIDCKFTDVSADAYYYKAVLWAVEKGITKGITDTTFAPDATVTRGQVVTFQWRAAGSKAVTEANPFTDVAADSYCADAVLWAVSEKITEGVTATTFAPVNPCTRAQIVTFLYRYLAN